MKIKIFSIIIVCVVAATVFYSCQEEESKSLELSVDKELIAASFSEEISYDVEITTNGEWEAFAYNSWCTVSPESGSGNGKITVSLQRNDIGETRSTSVEVSAKLGGNKKTMIIEMQQLPCEPTLRTSFTEKNVGFESEEVELVVTTNLPSWGVSLPKWCERITSYPLTYTKQDASLKEITVKFKVKQNTSRNVRTGTVGISGSGAPTVLATLTQDATEYLYVEASGGQVTKSFSGSWTVSSSESWCSVPASGSGDITFNAAANTDKMPRRSVLTISSAGSTQKVTVAQKPKLTPDRSQTWTDANGTRHTSIPADKEFWETGDVLEYNKATKGEGVNIVIFNDAFNKMELAVGGVYETSAKESAELFLDMPVLRDYKEHFNIYILMRVWEKSGLYNQYPNGSFRALWDGQQGRFLPHITRMPQLQGVPGNKVVGYYYAHGMSGGFMSQFSNGMTYSSYTFGVEPNYPYWTIHEFMGHALSLLGDMYLAPSDYSTWDFYPKSYLPVNPVKTDGMNDDWAANTRVAEWNQDAWDTFISLPGNSQYAGNLDSEYRRPLPSDYRQKHPSYTGGDYIWRIDYNGDFMNAHVMSSSGWSRYLVYRRLMRLGNLHYSVVDFFKNDQQYANVADWYTLLGLHGWAHSYQYDPHQAGGSPFSPWDE